MSHIVYGLIESGNLGLDHPFVLSALAVGIVALVAFLLLLCPKIVTCSNEDEHCSGKGWHKKS